MASSVIPQASDTCVTCGSVMTGNFCAQCGEKRLNPTKDFSIGKFLEQTIDGFTHFDSKFLRSFKALLFKPGFLTLEFINGRRTKYMKPVQIFIIASVLFYFLYPNARFFFASVKDVWLADEFGLDLNEAISQMAKGNDMTVRIATNSIELDAAHKSKAYLFFLIPFWGLAFFLLFWRSIRFIVPHIVFAAHCLSFLILLIMAYFPFVYLLRVLQTGDTPLIPPGVIFLIYLFVAIRRVYQRHIVWSVVKTLVALAIFVVLFVIYRQGITISAII